MKKTQKRVLGLFGLAVVFVMTLCAILLPAPGAQAESGTADAIEVRVVGSTPSINTDNVGLEGVITQPIQTIIVPYENLKTMSFYITYTDENGTEYMPMQIFQDLPVNYAPGNLEFTFNLLTGEYTYTYQESDFYNNIETKTESGNLDYYGYGKYVFSLSGVGYYDDEPVEKGIDFEFRPVDIDVTTNEDTGEITISTDYDHSEETGVVDKIEINIYDTDGNIMPISPIIIRAPLTDFTFNPADYGMAPGVYIYVVQAYDAAGAKVGPAYKFEFYYPGKKVHEVPDTGSMFSDLNISQTDFLITGLIIFAVTGVSGAIFIARHGKKTSRRRK